MFFSIWLFVLLLPLELSRRIAKRSFLSNPFSFFFHCIFRVVSFSFCPWICPGELPRTFFSRTLFVFSFVFSFVFLFWLFPRTIPKAKRRKITKTVQKIKNKITQKNKVTLLRVIPTMTFIYLLLANLLAFYLRYLLAFYLAYLLAFYLAYLLAYVLAYLRHTIWHSTWHIFWHIF